MAEPTVREALDHLRDQGNDIRRVVEHNGETRTLDEAAISRLLARDMIETGDAAAYHPKAGVTLEQIDRFLLEE